MINPKKKFSKEQKELLAKMGHDISEIEKSTNNTRGNLAKAARIEKYLDELNGNTAKGTRESDGDEEKLLAEIKNFKAELKESQKRKVQKGYKESRSERIGAYLEKMNS